MIIGTPCLISVCLSALIEIPKMITILKRINNIEFSKQEKSFLEVIFHLISIFFNSKTFLELNNHLKMFLELDIYLTTFLDLHIHFEEFSRANSLNNQLTFI